MSPFQGAKHTTIVNVKSDTVTLPSQEMLKAMSEATLGDMVLKGDQGVLDFQKYAAEYFGFEDSLICTTGTQTNLIAALTHCQRGEEMICGQNSHIFKYEGGGCSALASVHPQPIPHDDDGCINISQFESKIKIDDFHFAITRMVSLENPIFGRVWPLEKLIAIHKIAQKNNLKVHMDGARIINAAVALNIDVKVFSPYLDSMMVCFSKTLGCPFGSLLLGTKEFISRAQRPWKMVGGGLRQGGGLIAACAKLALKDCVSIIEADHRKAKEFKEFISAANLPGIKISHGEGVSTNMVVLDLCDGITSQMIKDHLALYNILSMSLDPKGIRIAFHKDVSDTDVDRLMVAFQTFKINK